MAIMITTENFDRTKFITGMRAYSAIAVFLIHSGGGGLGQMSNFFSNLIGFGKFGVISFFVISSFTIFMSIDSDSEFSYKKYLIRRFLRIAPLFYIITLVCYFFIGGIPYYLELFKIENSIQGVILHLSFLNLFNVRYLNYLVGVEWTIPIEFFYYIIIPPIFFYLKKNPFRIIHLLAFGFIISLLSMDIFSFLYNPIDKGISNLFSIEKYAFTYMCGFGTYFFYKKYMHLQFNSFHLFELLLILFVLIYLNIPYQEYYISIWVALLIIVASSQNSLTKILFENRIIQFLGKISYSIYLLHFIILNNLPKSFSQIEKFGFGFGFTILLSSVTYYLIEKPFIKYGKKIK